MKRISIVLAICFVVLGVFALSGCNNSKVENNEGKNSIKINEIETMASAKLMADSKVITKEELPENLQNLADLGSNVGVENNMITEIYTKSVPSSETFDELHDYSFLFSDDEEKSIKLNLSLIGTPLRDYFFQSSNNVSTISGVEVLLFQFRDRYLVQFSNAGINYDIETQGISQTDVVSFVESLIK